MSRYKGQLDERPHLQLRPHPHPNRLGLQPWRPNRPLGNLTSAQATQPTTPQGKGNNGTITLAAGLTNNSRKLRNRRHRHAWYNGKDGKYKLLSRLTETMII